MNKEKFKIKSKESRNITDNKPKVKCPICKSLKVKKIKETDVLLKYLCLDKRYGEPCGTQFLIKKVEEVKCLNCQSTDTKKVSENKYFCNECETHFMIEKETKLKIQL